MTKRTRREAREELEERLEKQEKEWKKLEEAKERSMEASLANLQEGQHSLEEALGRQAELLSRIQMMAGSTNIEARFIYMMMIMILHKKIIYLKHLKRFHFSITVINNTKLMLNPINYQFSPSLRIG